MKQGKLIQFRRPLDPASVPAGFAHWWETYREAIRPRPLRDKEETLALWGKLGCEKEADALVSRLAVQARYRRQMEQAGEFCPALPEPKRYLKRRLWQEEIPV